MKCHEFQTAIGADPSSTHPDVLAHLESCSACAAYRRQMQEMDRLIYKALVVRVDEAALARATRERPAAHKPSVGRWQIAASLVASVLIAASVWVASTRESLAEQLVLHTERESFMMVRTDDRVDRQVLDDILARSGVSLRADAADVSHAAICLFRGKAVPHFIVQTNEGPVTVMVLADEKPASKKKRFAEEGYEGMIVPAPQGVLAVLGKDVSVEEATEKVLHALIW
ncbi:MAG: DUF3379 domain-containing protein [Xanthomonadaceae bacterium]|nr:DUF3379 domain-containing protein [Xanthomonadaceae bacterium]